MKFLCSNSIQALKRQNYKIWISHCPASVKTQQRENLQIQSRVPKKRDPGIYDPRQLLGEFWTFLYETNFLTNIYYDICFIFSEFMPIFGIN